MEDYAIRIRDVSKVYKLYNRPSDRLVDTFGLPGKKAFKEHRALDHVSFDIKKGESIGILGTNGSGTSTILKIITGVLNQTEGDVEINGRISALLELGAGFNMEYTGMENIYLNGTMLGYTKEEVEERIPEILKFADIGDFINQPVKSYSSGMFVRLAFAVAINIEPEILIVDEALSVGDVFFQSKCYKKFEEFKAQGKTILFVSHDLSSIARYCDRVILLNKGVMLGEGSPKEMIDAYKRVLVGQEQKEGASVGTGVNPDAQQYGNGKAVISEIVIEDETGLNNNSILKGSYFTVHMKVRVAEDIEMPIFAFSIKDIKGTEITGTNSMIEKSFMQPVKAGEEKCISFRQQMNLQGGDYLLSFGVTGYENDDFCVYHRLYDAVNITVVSDKNTVGYYDMNSEVTVK